MATRIDELMHHTIEIKKLLEPAFVAALTTINEQLLPNFVVVIGGGEAFNYYFRDLPIFETHDYDLRLVSLTQPTPTELPYHGTLDSVVTQLYNVLYQYEQQSSPIQVYKKKHNLNIRLIPVRTLEMTNGPRGIRLEFVGEMWDALVDLTMYAHELFPSYTFDDVPITKDYIDRMTASMPEDTYGFIKLPMRKHIVRDEETGLYYLKLGYMVWDTIRMINWSFISYQKGGMNKLERYMKKYTALLDALSHPEKYMNCRAAKEYITFCMQRAATKANVCHFPEPAQQVVDKDTLIDLAIANHYFPASWRPFLQKITFPKVCQQVHTAYKTKLA